MAEETVIEGQIVESHTDGRTNEIIPAGASRDIASEGEQISIDLVRMDQVGMLQLDDKAKTVLEEKLDPLDVLIRPDGNVYVPWPYYAGRLNRAFGILQWGLIPQGSPGLRPIGKYGQILVAWGHWLIVRGTPIGFAIGETTYNPTNPMMSYADACEGAKSSSLARNCKLLGMTLELWDAEWVANWKRQYAEQYTDDKGNLKWRKKRASSQPQTPKSNTATVVTKPTTTPAPVVPEPVPEQPKAEEQHPENVNMLQAKARWIEAAINKHLIATSSDATGIRRLIALLGDTYSTIDDSNASDRMPKGLEIINNWQVGNKA